MTWRLKAALSSADGLVGAGLLVAVLVFAIVGPALWVSDPINGTLAGTFRPPGAELGGQWHPLGTDQLGRDLLARIMAGARLSLGIVVVAGLISAIIGTALGVVAGYAGGWTDAAIMRLADIQLSIPFILLVLLIVSVLGPSVANLIIVLGITGWAIFARVARARTLEVRELEYVEAARALGLPRRRILVGHVLPNIATPQIVLLTLDLPRLVVLEASVGFLGLGVQPPVPTLGNLIGDGRSYLLVADWLVVYPGLVIAALVVGFNLLGDWLVKRTQARLA
ncbi:MAG: ABC transporter permease [Hyphomicrobiales bacterium]